MRFMVLLIAAVVLLPGTAAAQSPNALRHTGVAVLSCDRAAHDAYFQATMSAHGRAKGLEVKFVLQARRLEAGSRWARIGAPGFEKWIPSDAGVSRFVYQKGVTNLVVGYAYRTLVRFRFRATDGTVVGLAARRTRQCRQPDLRPNLRVVRLRPGALNGDGTQTYNVTITNDGATDAPPSQLALDVNGARYLFAAADVAAGDTEFESFDAPACSAAVSVSATADAAAAIAERDEEDNVVTVACPS